VIGTDFTGRFKHTYFTIVGTMVPRQTDTHGLDSTHSLSIALEYCNYFERIKFPLVTYANKNRIWMKINIRDYPIKT